MASDSPPGTTGTAAAAEPSGGVYPADWRAELTAAFWRAPQEAFNYVGSLEQRFLDRDRSIELDPEFEPDEPWWMLEDLVRMCPHHADPIIDWFGKAHGDEFQRAVYHRFCGRHARDRRSGATALRPRERRARPRERRARSSRRTRAPGSSDDGGPEPPPPSRGAGRPRAPPHLPRSQFRLKRGRRP